jgi:hypothetical protein
VSAVKKSFAIDYKKEFSLAKQELISKRYDSLAKRIMSIIQKNKKIGGRLLVNLSQNPKQYFAMMRNLSSTLDFKGKVSLLTAIDAHLYYIAKKRYAELEKQGKQQPAGIPLNRFYEKIRDPSFNEIPKMEGVCYDISNFIAHTANSMGLKAATISVDTPFTDAHQVAIIEHNSTYYGITYGKIVGKGNNVYDSTGVYSDTLVGRKSLLYPEFIDIIRILMRYSYKIGICTNGILINKELLEHILNLEIVPFPTGTNLTFEQTPLVKAVM